VPELQHSDLADAQVGDGDQSQEDTTSTQVGRRQQQQQQSRSQSNEDSGSGDSAGDSAPMTAREAKELRREAQQLRRRIKEVEQADMTEQQRLKSDLDELQGSHGQLLGRVQTAEKKALEYQAQIALYKAGAMHPELIAAQLTADDLVDDKATKATIERLKKEYPDLFGVDIQGSGDGAVSGSSVRTPSSMNSMMRAMSMSRRGTR
jgi:hypothetical protein